MGKDALARGAREASYNLNQGESELVADLKLQPKEFVIEKYGMLRAEYESYLKMLENGEHILPLSPLKVVQINEEENSITYASDQVFQEGDTQTISAPEAAKVGYIGQAFGNQILVEVLPPEHTSKLILPDIQKSRSDIGSVRSVGDQCSKRPKVGSLVLFDSYAATGREIELVDVDGVTRKLLIVGEDDILVALKKVRVNEFGEAEKPSWLQKLLIR